MAQKEKNQHPLIRKMEKAIADILENETFTEAKMLFDLNTFPDYQSASPEDKALMEQALADSWIASRGYLRNAFRVSYLSEPKQIVSQSIRKATAKMVDIKNHPFILLRLDEGIVSINHPRNISFQFLRPEDEKSRMDVIIRLRAEDLDEFLDKTEFIALGHQYKLQPEEIQYSPNSLRTYYGYRDTYFVRWTKTRRDTWWNLDCPDVYRYKVNTDSNRNDWGFCFATWSSPLIETGFDTVTIDESMTEEERNLIVHGHEDTWLGEKILKRFQTMHEDDIDRRTLVQETAEANIHSIRGFAEDYQNEMLAYAYQILIHGIETDFDAMADALRKMDGSYGLDCGWVRLKYFQKEINDLMEEAYIYTSPSYLYPDGSFSIPYPIDVQSTTIQKAMAVGLIKALEKKDILLDVVSVLD